MVLALAALFFLWQCWSAASRWSLTFDEVVHVPAGYVYWTAGDFSYNAEHPPLAKLFATLPLLVTSPKVPALEGWPWCSGYQFFFADNPTRSVLLPPRVMISLLSLLAGAVVYAWGRRLLGTGAAVVSAVLLAFEPTFTAHSSLVTTDAPLTVFFVGTVAAFWWCVERLTWTRLIVLAAAFSAAMTTKFSAMVLVPVLALLAVAGALLRNDMEQTVWPLSARSPAASLATWRRRLAALLGAVAFAGVVCFAAIWAVYGFSVGGGEVADPRHAAAVETTIDTLRGEGVKVARQPFVFLDRHRILPHAYLAGLVDVIRHNAVGRSSFLLGERAVRGRPLYFVATFLLKTTVPLLLLLAVALSLLRRGVLGKLEIAFLTVPIAVHFLVAIGSNLNIGHRHLLPSLPFLALLAASPLGTAPMLEARKRTRLRGAMALLLLWCGYESVRYRPHFLSYFNQLAGGPEEGYTALVDSNLDWGQDLYLLEKWVADNNATGLRLSYFGPAWPDRDAGIPGAYVTLPRLLCRPPPATVPLRDGDLLAISATYLQGVSISPEGAFDFLRQYRPLARVGYSIFIYRIDDAYLLKP